MLDTLFAAQYDSKAIDDDGIQEEVDTFVFTGHDTVSSAITYTLLCIAEHTEVQEKLYEEIKDAFSKCFKRKNFCALSIKMHFKLENCDPAEPYSVHQISSLFYLDLVVKESLRILPPVPMITRTLREDVVINGVNIPATSEIVMMIYDLHHNPDVFPDPETFIPERFLPENVAKRHRFAYVPFSAGVRNCVGKFVLFT